MKTTRILVLQPRRLGDLLLATPLVRALHRQLDAAVDVLVEPPYLQALAGNPHVHAAVLAGGWPPLLLRLRRTGYDAVIDCLGSPRTARLAFLSGARRRIGFVRPWRTAFYSEPVPPPPAPLYSAIEKLSLARPLGATGTDSRLDLAVTDADRHEAEAFLAAAGVGAEEAPVAFSPVSRRADKRWPAERFARLCDRWHESRGWRFLPFLGPGERDQVDAVVRAARHSSAFLPVAPPLRLAATRAAMERCRLYLGNDNALRHVAIAARLPTAAVFGHPRPVCWTPPADPRHAHAGGGRPIGSVSLAEAEEAFAPLLLLLSGRG